MSGIEILREKRVKARKAHACNVCSSTAVQVGDTYLRQTNVYDGRIYDWVTCLPCSLMTSDVWDWASYVEDGIGEDTYIEWAEDNPGDPRTIAFYQRMGWTDE